MDSFSSGVSLGDLERGTLDFRRELSVKRHELDTAGSSCRCYQMPRSNGDVPQSVSHECVLMNSMELGLVDGWRQHVFVRP